METSWTEEDRQAGRQEGREGDREAHANCSSPHPRQPCLQKFLSVSLYFLLSSLLTKQVSCRGSTIIVLGTLAGNQETYTHKQVISCWIIPCRHPVLCNFLLCALNSPPSCMGNTCLYTLYYIASCLFQLYRNCKCIFLTLLSPKFITVSKCSLI